MDLWRRLDSMDRRIVAWQDRKFDEPRPWWVRYVAFVSVPLIFSFSFARRDGGAWWLAAAVSSGVWLVTLVLVSRWTRTHRRRKDEFDTAVDRQL